MVQQKYTIKDGHIEILRAIEKELIKRGGSGLGEMMDTLIVGLREKLNSNDSNALEGSHDEQNLTPLYEPDETGEENPVPKSQAGIIAKARQQEIQGFFNNHGLGQVVVPLPNISDQEFEARREKGQALFFRPATKDLSYEYFMRVMGQGDNWTVVDGEQKAMIIWEPAPQSYWFWTEVQTRCPRRGTSWDDSANKLNFHLLSLEEYVIVFHTHKVLTSTIIDLDSSVWLRTKYQHKGSFGVLFANERNGSIVNVYRHQFNNFQNALLNIGGRLAEAIKP